MSTSTRNGLECRLGLGRIVLPTEAVDQFGEYRVGAKLPLNDRIGYAIGVWVDAPILSISLGQHPAEPSRLTNGALLVTGVAGIRCAFEIDEPLGLVSVTIGGATPTIPWRRTATLEDGRSVQFVDIPLLLRELLGAPAS